MIGLRRLETVDSSDTLTERHAGVTGCGTWDQGLTVRRRVQGSPFEPARRAQSRRISAAGVDSEHLTWTRQSVAQVPEPHCCVDSKNNDPGRSHRPSEPSLPVMGTFPASGKCSLGPCREHRDADRAPQIDDHGNPPERVTDVRIDRSRNPRAGPERSHDRDDADRERADGEDPAGRNGRDETRLSNQSTERRSGLRSWSTRTAGVQATSSLAAMAR